MPRRVGRAWLTDVPLSDLTASGRVLKSATTSDFAAGVFLGDYGGMTAIPSAGSIQIDTVVGDTVVRVAGDATVADVARAIIDHQVGAVVIGESPRPTAVVSERDVVRVVAEGREPGSVPALEVAATNLAWCAADATVDDVAIRMMDRYIRHILVDRDGALVGIVSARDLLGVCSGDAEPDFGNS